MSRFLPSEYRQRLQRLPEFSKLLPLVLEGKGSDEEVLSVATIIEVFKPKTLDSLKLAKLVNTLISRRLYDEARKLLSVYEARDVAKAMIIKALSSEKPTSLESLIDVLNAVDIEAIRNTNAAALIRSTNDKELLEIAKKYITPNNLESRLWILGEVFYGSKDEDLLEFLLGMLKRYPDKAARILDTIVDIRPDVDWRAISKRLGYEDLRRLVKAGGKSKKILAKIEDALVEGLLLGWIGQLLHDYPDLLPVGEYILENRLRLRIPEDDRRGTFMRALHFFPGIKGLEDKVIYLLADAIKYAIENEDVHLLRIAVSQLADLKIHPDLKAKVIAEAIKGIEETDRFFDALDVILRHLIFDERLAAKIAVVVANTLPDLRAMLAVFGDALRRLLASPAAYEVLEALIEAKPGDKAISELIALVTDERAKIRASIKAGEGYEKFDPYKVLLYAYDLLKPNELIELLKRVEPDEKILPALKLAADYVSKEDLSRFEEKLSRIPITKAAPLYIPLAAKFGEEKLLEKLLNAEDIDIDYDLAETLVMLPMKTAERVIEKFLDKEPIIAAIATAYYNSPKALEYAKKLATRDKSKALALITRAFSGTNNLEAAELALELAEDPLGYILEIAPEAIYVEPLYGKIKSYIERVVQG